VGLPQLETLVSRMRRNKILLEDAQEELRRARTAPRAARAATRPTPDSPVASLEFVCDRTG
jgi:outer membrane protein TolC